MPPGWREEALTMKRSSITMGGPVLALMAAVGAAVTVASCASPGTGPAGTAGTPSRTAGPARTATPRPAGSQPAATAPAGTWTLLPAAPVTALPDRSASAWTGQQMIIRGTTWSTHGMQRVTFAYDPATGSWATLPRGPKPPVSEGQDVAVWTGSQLLLIGPTSAAYTPASRTWRAIPRWNLGEPPSSIAAWTGREAIVWGGTCCGGSTRNGGLYNPATGTWRTIPDAPFQSRVGVAGSWTGTELVLAGGWAGHGSSGTFKDGAAYNPVTGQWRAIPPMPRREGGAVAVWDGTEVLFLGGSRPGATGPPARGLAFNPATGTWRELPPMAYPRTGFAAVWTGRQLLVWGGLTGPYKAQVIPPHGEAYNPAGNRWTALPKAPLHGRAMATAVWTGRSMIVWGGSAPNGQATTPFTDGAIYLPGTP
jgi:Kelch motif protein